MLIANAVLLISAAVCSTASSTSSGRPRRGVVYTNPEIQEPPRVPPLRDTNRPHHRQVSRDAQKLPHASPNGEYGSVPSKGPLSQADSLKSPLAPYFDKTTDPYGIGAKALDASKLIVSPSLSKLQHVYSPAYNSFQQDKPIELAGFADFAGYPSYGDISKLIQAQDFPQAAVQVPLYKTSYPKVADYNAPSDKDEATPAKDRQKDQAIVKVNGKKISVPVIQVQSGPSVLFDSQPFLQPSYPSATAEPAALNFASGASKFNLTPEQAAPFLSPLSSFQSHVVPIQTASSPQFPQYKGAAIQVYSVPSNLPSTQTGYESLYNQPQLQFVKEHGGQPTGNTQPVSTGDILDDAEVINKKHPEPHTPQPDDDDDEDERYKSFPEKHEHSSEEDDAERGKSGKRFKEPPTESDFKPSTSFPFKEYDEKFGKHRAQTDDDDSDDKPYSSYKNYSSNDDDDDGEDESSSEDRAKYVKPSRDSYEEEEENANEKHERHEEFDDDDDDSRQTGPKRSRYYGKDFEQEFEQSYRKELPKYMPEVDDYSDPKRREKGTHERYDDEPKGGRSQNRNRKVSRPGYRDSTAYGTHVSVSKTPRVIHEEFFGYGDPKTVLPKSSPKWDDKGERVRAAKHYQGFKGSFGLGKASHGENNQNGSESWKKASTGWSGQLAGPREGAAFYGANLVNGRSRSLTNAEILRDLTGI